ncbi:hypothetical protein [Streptomyces johnsoniae]|uniref:Uncharacterized protein n=1 Tax=Streptomyces johnsoniae TaxID=3075532 RepID=A0ABU2S0V2_9ACTN|nr:hypothetical protein [Streptomyces sp. DSM 41886]MDT0442622.1 hypothetical protein [Streptomyces sp. DSM 41886]
MEDFLLAHVAGRGRAFGVDQAPFGCRVDVQLAVVDQVDPGTFTEARSALFSVDEIFQGEQREVVNAAGGGAQVLQGARIGGEAEDRAHGPRCGQETVG